MGHVTFLKNVGIKKWISNLKYSYEKFGYIIMLVDKQVYRWHSVISKRDGTYRNLLGGTCGSILVALLQSMWQMHAESWDVFMEKKWGEIQLVRKRIEK
jgi:hypothetical protein